MTDRFCDKDLLNLTDEKARELEKEKARELDKVEDEKKRELGLYH